MPFLIVRNDITAMSVDAIVNAANNRLKAGGGVCGAIFSRAGRDKLTAACDAIGFCATGDAVITDGFESNARYIIHTVGPVYGYNPSEEERQLYSCYFTSLKLAQEHSLHSVAFPVISSGIYGYPRDEALKVAQTAIGDFLAQYDSGSDGEDMTVYLIVYDKQTYTAGRELFDEVQSYIDEKLVVEDTRRSFSEEMQSICSVPLPKESKPAPRSKFTDILHRKTSSDDALDDCMPADMCYTGAPQLDELDELVSKNRQTFSQMLLCMIDERGLTDAQVYKRANIDRKLFSKMRKPDYVPKKSNVIALAFALKLSTDEADNFLARAGYAFSECSRFDIIVQYCLTHNIYDVFKVNEILFDFAQPLLGE